MVLGDYFVEAIQTQRGGLKVGPIAVEPVSDIAVLGALDDQTFSDEAQAFEQFCSATNPVPLAQDHIELHRPFRVRIYNHDGTWAKGSASLTTQFSPSIWIKAEKEIGGGASGGPILNLKGELVGLVSNSSVPNGNAKSTGLCPRPLQALPVWVCHKFLNRRLDRSRCCVRRLQSA